MLSLDTIFTENIVSIICQVNIEEVSWWCTWRFGGDVLNNKGSKALASTYWLLYSSRYNMYKSNSTQLTIHGLDNMYQYYVFIK